MPDTIVKPGYKTTEFWLSAIATLFGIALSSGAINTTDETSMVSKIVGGIIAVLAALGYTAARGKAKSE